MRIAIACSSLCSKKGASENAAVNLAAEMRRRGHDILLLSLTKKRAHLTPAFPLAQGIRHLALEESDNYREIRHLREFLIADGTDVFIAMESGREHLFWCMACMGTGIPLICSERNDPSLIIEKNAWDHPKRLAVLSGADAIHELLPEYLSSIPEAYRIKARVIPSEAPFSVINANRQGEKGKAVITCAPQIVYDQWETLLTEMASRKGHTVMDAMYEEPFASMARLSSAARREWLDRDFGEAMPYNSRWFWARGRTLLSNIANNIFKWLSIY